MVNDDRTTCDGNLDASGELLLTARPGNIRFSQAPIKPQDALHGAGLPRGTYKP